MFRAGTVSSYHVLRLLATASFACSVLPAVGHGTFSQYRLYRHDFYYEAAKNLRKNASPMRCKQRSRPYLTFVAPNVCDIRLHLFPSVPCSRSDGLMLHERGNLRCGMRRWHLQRQRYLYREWISVGENSSHGSATTHRGGQ